jgi:Domain of unknown function (DUF4372)
MQHIRSAGSSRLQFESVVRKHQDEQHARDFNCWWLFAATLFCSRIGHLP